LTWHAGNSFYLSRIADRTLSCSGLIVDNSQNPVHADGRGVMAANLTFFRHQAGWLHLCTPHESYCHCCTYCQCCGTSLASYSASEQNALSKWLCGSILASLYTYQGRRHICNTLAPSMSLTPRSENAVQQSKPSIPTAKWRFRRSIRQTQRLTAGSSDLEAGGSIHRFATGVVGLEAAALGNQQRVAIGK
jgi:hypothetical protein